MSTFQLDAPQSTLESKSEGLLFDNDDRVETESDKLFKMYLDRLYIQLNEQNMSAKRKQLKLPKPKLNKQGGVKTIWENFGLTSECLNRPVDHMLKYFSSELSTECSISRENDSSLRQWKLVIKGKGRYNSTGIITVLHSYMDTYVQCKVCGEMNTEMIKEQRQYFINCKGCLSKWCCQ